MSSASPRASVAADDAGEGMNAGHGHEPQSASPRAGRAGHHLVLVGLPGSGKSTVGRLVAELAGTPFLDMDVEIERRVGLPITDIFQRYGEAHFRKLERDLTHELRETPGQVVAPGGGWIVDPGNLALLRPPARIIHLRVSVDVALTRLGTEAVSRPLLMKGDPHGNLTLLDRQRSPLYAAADAAVDTQTFVPQEVAHMVRELASRWDWPVG